MDFPTAYQEFIYKSRYARWNPDKGRRETWSETVNRYYRFMRERVPRSLLSEFKEACEGILSLSVVPSMRTLWTAGKALETENLAGYNCAYTVVDDLKSFSEILYVLLNGTGVGFSVEWKYVNQLPEIPKMTSKATPILFMDSKLGWAKGFYKFLTLLSQGIIPEYDLSKIRPAGAKLKTFGGRASGPEPLQELLEYTKTLFVQAQGRKLTPLECHDLVCQIANCVVVGGVRRSAMISLSDLNETEMRHAKDGEFWIKHPNRMLANNSAVHEYFPDCLTFLEEWVSLMRSGSGERGIVNREALRQAARKCGRKTSYDFGLNPCGEVILRPKQLCNLSEAILRPTDKKEDIAQKVRWATILGVVQSTLTDFNFVSAQWQHNCEEERLLGVSLTGLNNSMLSVKDYFNYTETVLEGLRNEAHKVAEQWAKALGINRPQAVTCVKPSGTVSQLMGTTSGLHTGYARYYIRRVRQDVHDPITELLIQQGVPHKPETGTSNVLVFEFPMKCDAHTVLRNEVSALRQLEYWKMLKTRWCDHNPSATIYVEDHEWIDVGAWVFKNWNVIGGLSFLPHDGGVYELAPYEEITKEHFQQMLKEFPTVNFKELAKFEKEDETVGAHEYACLGSSCEL